MNDIPAPVQMRDGDYAKRYPRDEEALREEGRAAMRRNGCKSIRFQVTEAGLIVHGYVGRFDGPEVERL